MNPQLYNYMDIKPAAAKAQSSLFELQKGDSRYFYELSI